MPEAKVNVNDLSTYYNIMNSPLTYIGCLATCIIELITMYLFFNPDRNGAQCLVFLPPSVNQYCGSEDAIIVSSASAIQVPNYTYWTHPLTSSKKKGESHWVTRKSMQQYLKTILDIIKY